MREKIALTPQEAREKAAGAKIRRKNGYLYLDQPAQQRSNAAMREQALQAFVTKKPVQGVKGPTIVACIPRLDISRSVYAGYLHGVCLGVVKHFLKLMLTVRGPWNVSEYKDELDQFMKTIAPTDDICRLPRAVSDFAHWKGSE
ncbi:Transcription factor IIIA [Frankliniella fusca]|uniref:Transcription factor IIIA n=1 Tax=Frankliniella fusca TaxID=407009 RepID=A0AAE1HPX2_9NEOP|nr:Transcription factor IIIA [Frankliniella fusca]